MMKGFKITNTDFNQEVNLPPGQYTYSCWVIPMDSTYTFKIDDLEFTYENLTPNILSKRIKYTFELFETGVVFYPSTTQGDCVYEPQIEEGIFASSPGPHKLDYERLISEAGIEIDPEILKLYAKKSDVSAEIRITADQINSVVGGISNDVDEMKTGVTSITQTVNSITSTVANHTTKISTFQQTVDQIYLAIEDVGSGEFASILQRLDGIELKVGAPGQSGSIHVAINEISSTVSDVSLGMSQISQTVTSISSTVYDEHGALLSQISQDGVNVRITASQIKLEGAVTANGNFKVLTDGSIEAKNGKFTGQITSTSGTIGGFNIGSTYIGTGSPVGGSVNGMSLSNDFIVFNQSGKQALIGTVSVTGFDFLGRFTDTTSKPGYTKTGVIINISGGYKNNALDVTGDILLKGNMSLQGAIDGLSVRTRQISTTTYLTSEDVYVSCYNSTSITVYLPSSPVIGKVIFIRTINTTVTINGNGKTINWGTGTGVNKGVGNGIGDTAMLVYDGQFWMYNYMVR